MSVMDCGCAMVLTGWLQLQNLQIRAPGARFGFITRFTWVSSLSCTNFSISFRNERTVSVFTYEKCLNLECSSMKTRQENIPEETEKQGNPAFSLYYLYGLCYLQNVKHNLCVSHCANVSIWQECTTDPWLVWESGTLAFSKEHQVLCHINKWQLWKWIHFKRTCQPETCPLCKKTFQNIFRLISSLNFPHHS